MGFRFPLSEFRWKVWSAAMWWLRESQHRIWESSGIWESRAYLAHRCNSDRTVTDVSQYVCKQKNGWGMSQTLPEPWSAISLRSSSICTATAAFRNWSAPDFFQDFVWGWWRVLEIMSMRRSAQVKLEKSFSRRRCKQNSKQSCLQQAGSIPRPQTRREPSSL